MRKSDKRRKKQKQELKEKHFNWGLKPGAHEGRSFSRVSKLIESVNVNPEAYKALAGMKEKVDEKIYKKVLMNPEFMRKFIKVHQGNRKAAEELLEYAKKFKKVEEKKMLDVSSNLKGRLSISFEELQKIYGEKRREKKNL